MKIAISGKGGVGKTTLAAGLSMLLAKEGKQVIAIDADPDSNLASALGINGEVKPLSAMIDLIKERVGEEGFIKLNPKVDDILKNYSVKKGNINFIQLGTIKKADSGCFCPPATLLKALLRHLIFNEEEFLIMDMEAGLEHLGRGLTKGIDLLIIVIEPGQRSIETAKKIRKLSEELGIRNVRVILNKARGCLVAEGLNIDGIIPFDGELVEADLRGEPLPTNSFAFEAIEKIKEKLIPTQ